MVRRILRAMKMMTGFKKFGPSINPIRKNNSSKKVEKKLRIRMTKKLRNKRNMKTTNIGKRMRELLRLKFIQ